jgi:dTDP-4-amino-4,6-dideoxy-D-galactose acyltransferase
MKSEKSLWDSEFWKKEIYNLYLNREDTFQVEDLKGIPAELIYIYSPKEISSNDSRLELMDIKITYSKRVNSGISHAFIPEYTGKSNEQLVDLSIQSGQFSRFKLDPRLNHKFEEFYTLWIENSLSGSFADKVLAAYDEDRVVGVVTLQKKDPFTGKIGIIAVDGNFRGKKIGHKLLESAENYFYELGVKELEVVTQKENKGACNFYEKNGFTVKDIKHVYHFWV